MFTPELKSTFKGGAFSIWVFVEIELMRFVLKVLEIAPLLFISFKLSLGNDSSILL